MTPTAVELAEAWRLAPVVMAELTAENERQGDRIRELETTCAKFLKALEEWDYNDSAWDRLRQNVKNVLTKGTAP